MVQSCTQPTVTEEQFLKLSYVSFTLTAAESEEIVITIDSNPAWKAESRDSWLKIIDLTPTTLTVVADPNTGEERSGTVVVTAGESQREITVKQLGTPSSLSARYRLLSELTNAAMSPSGRYVGGFRTGVLGENSYQFTPVIIDMETDQWYELGPYPESLHDLFETEAMTDQGILYITDSGNGGVVGFSIDGDYFTPAKLENCGPTVIQGSSADGKVLVGYAEGSPEGYIYAPLKIVDGVGELLPMPEKNFRGEDFWAGIMVRGVSADGSVIYGTTWENHDYGMVYWDRNGEVHYVGEDVHTLVETVTIDNGRDEPYEYSLYNGMISDSNQTMISPSGEWIAGTYRTETLKPDGVEVASAYCPAFYNTVTGKTTILNQYSGCSSNGVTDEGIGFINDGRELVTTGRVVDLKSGAELGTTDSWISDKYGIVVPNSIIEYASPDGKCVLGMKGMAAAGDFYYVYWYIGPSL